MMKIITVLLSFLTFLICSCNNEDSIVQNDLQKNNIFGHVSEIREMSNSKAFYIDRVDNESYNKYDRDGFLEESSILKPDGNISVKSLFSYDDNRNLIEEKFVGEENELFIRIERQFDDNGNILRYIMHEGSDASSKKYKYYEEKNLVKEFDYDIHGNLQSIMGYKYDKKGFLIEQTWYDENGIFQTKLIFANDDTGKPITEKFYKSDGILKATTNYKYDEFYNQKVVNRVDTDMKFSFNIKYYYKYDSQNNWIEKVSIRDEKLMFIYRRKIKYYNSQFD